MMPSGRSDVGWATRRGTPGHLRPAHRDADCTNKPNGGADAANRANKPKPLPAAWPPNADCANEPNEDPYTSRARTGPTEPPHQWSRPVTARPDCANKPNGAGA